MGLDQIKIDQVDVIKKEKKLVVRASSTIFLPYQEERAFFHNLQEKLCCGNVELHLRCTQPMETVLDQPMFWDSMLCFLQHQDKGAWALLHGSRCSFRDGELVVWLEKKVSLILLGKHVDMLLDRYISQLWDCHVAVVFRDPQIVPQEREAEEEPVVVGFTASDYEKARAESKGQQPAAGGGRFFGEDGASKGFGGRGTPYHRGDGKSSGRKRRLTPEEGQELPRDASGCEILLGRPIADPITRMKDISMDSGYVAVQGRVFQFESKPIPSGSVIALIQMTDGSYSITAKFFFDKEDQKFVTERFAKKKNLHIKVYGEAIQDKYTRELTIMARSIVEYKPEKRMDRAEKKRVELHLHTCMSALDAITRPDALVKRVLDWGHSALAITDHGIVQAYPDIFNAAKKSDLKIIYGVECYLTDQPGEIPAAEAKKTPSWHCILLVRNLVGLKNLYKMISYSNLKYFYKKPRIPRFVLEQYREGILVGSACSEGELYHALMEGAEEEELLRMASFYDYLEIQPSENNMYMIREGLVNSLKEIEEYNKHILALGDRLDKMTVATCDVHFLDPEDDIYRCVMQAGQGYKDADTQPPLYLRTTEEMLREFTYLGDRAYEVVVENTNKVADMIEKIRPVPDGFFPPVIEGSDEQLRESSYKKARETYGENLPEIVAKRLERELNAIISNGYSIMYITARELVAESARNGYQVGSRGSVGSSLAAYMSGITEVNSLPAHYRCESCLYLEFHDGEGLDCGFDMPEKACPVCGEPLTRDGFDIPFETFLGFNGDKVPDIDLNFASDDQPNAHKYTEVLFGADYVFRAGTISGLAEKTARGYVLKYLEERNMHASEAEINRLASGFIGVKRTTGQHPGGIMVIPKDKEIFDFTPIQHPADAVDSSIVTTHFDYHFLHDNILKLDILGHDGPAILRLLEDYSGVPCKDAKLDDERVMSLFNSPDALDMDPDLLKIDIPVGTLGIPEFGTNFVKQMLLETRPTSISELVRISGLSHGTDVWSGNAQSLIKEGTCTLSEAICCRDDIMLYLINKGLDKKLSFTIMESVRKGKGLTKEQEEEMRAHNVPNWYIGSCKKIKYMFPKAHAVAYVVLSVRIAWYKLYYPKEYYAARFTLKVDQFDAATMIHGADKAYAKMALMGLVDAEEDQKANDFGGGDNEGGELTAKEEGQAAVYEQLLEMYARGISFLPIDLYQSDAKQFIPEGDGIRPPFCALQGLGLSAAESIVKAREEGGEFISIEDLKIRSGVNKGVMEVLRAEGCLDGLPESNQLSLFG